MKLLTSAESTALRQAMRENLPYYVLAMLATQAGRRESFIIAEALRWLPQGESSTGVYAQVAGVLDWATSRGDIEHVSRGRYQVLPPYALMTRNQEIYRFMLYGDVRIDGRLAEQFAHEGVGDVVLIHGWAEEEDDNGEVEDRESYPIGLDRWIDVSPALTANVQRACAELGVVVISAQELAQGLPRLEDLTAPPQREFEEAPLLTGSWDGYDPKAEPWRWRRDPNWKRSKTMLVRWRPTEDWRGTRMARYFYNAGRGRVAELHGDATGLWQLHLDAEAGRPRAVWYDGSVLWVPRVIPFPTQQWLRTIAGPGAHQRGPWLLLPMESANPEVRLVLQQTLKLPWREGEPSIPSHKHSRHSSQKARSAP